MVGTLVTKRLIHRLMVHGKKLKAERIFLNTIQKVRKTSKIPFYMILLRSLFYVSPMIVSKAVRKGGGVFFVPFPLLKKKQLFIGISWLVKEARKNKGGRQTKRQRNISDRLAFHLLQSCKNKGLIVKKKQNEHKSAIKGRALIHFRW